MTAVAQLKDREWMPARPWASPAGQFVITAPHAESVAEVRAAWLQARRAMCTASDVAALFGVSKWTDPWRLWAEKTGRLEPDAQTYPMLRGQVLEDAIVDLWQATVPYEVRTRRVGLMRSRAHPLIGASIDRLSVCSERPYGCITELKSNVNPEQWDGDEVPVETQFQVIQQLLVSGRDHAHVVRLDGYLQVHERTIERDEDLMAAIVGKVEPWWQRHIVEDVEPDASGLSSEALGRLYGNPNPDLEFVLPELLAAAPTQVDALNAQIAELERQRDDLKARVKQAAGNASLIKAPDGVTTEWTWRPTAKIAGATAAWRKTNVDLVAPFTREVPVEEVDLAALVAANPDLLGDGGALYKVRQLRRVKH